MPLVTLVHSNRMKRLAFVYKNSIRCEETLEKQSNWKGAEKEDLLFAQFTPIRIPANYVMINWDKP